MNDKRRIELTIGRLEMLLFDNVAAKVMTTEIRNALYSERERLINVFMKS